MPEYFEALSSLWLQRLGNSSLDVAGFKKEILQEGWTFQAVFIIHDDIIVYKLWSGEPKRLILKRLGHLGYCKV